MVFFYTINGAAFGQIIANRGPGPSFISRFQNIRFKISPFVIVESGINDIFIMPWKPATYSHR